MPHFILNHFCVLLYILITCHLTWSNLFVGYLGFMWTERHSAVPQLRCCRVWFKEAAVCSSRSNGGTKPQTSFHYPPSVLHLYSICHSCRKYSVYLENLPGLTIHTDSRISSLTVSFSLHFSWPVKMVRAWGNLTCNGFNGFTGDRLAGEIILDEAGGLRRDLHWMLGPLGPSIDHLCFRIGICGQKTPRCESLTVYCEQWSIG